MSGKSNRAADQTVLSPSEAARAAAFALDIHRDRYIQCRAALRRLLAEHLETSPSAIQLSSGKFGKPKLAELAGGPQIHFNVSHCDDLAVLAFTLDHRVGIDIERVRNLDNMQGLADACFSTSELQAFASVASEQRALAFFHCWTRKEALIKAIGDGLSRPRAHFNVTLQPAEAPALFSKPGSGVRAKDWTLLDWSPFQGYVGAVAVENSSGALVDNGWLGNGPQD